MRKFWQGDWFWIVLIVLIVMGFNTIRDISKDSLTKVCIAQGKTFVDKYEEKSCK